MPMFSPNLFTEEEYMELGNVSTMPKEHKCICSRSEAFILEATSQIEGLTAIMSKEWIDKVESSSSIIQIYHDFRILLCTIGHAEPQEVLYDPKVWQNQLELYRLKYASPHWRATSYFKRYNTIGLSGNVPINHRTQDPTRYLTRR
jgi:hypothetical protein